MNARITGYNLALSRTLVVLAGLTAGLTGSSMAADFPSKPIEVIIPYAAGGTVDAVTRLVADEMKDILGQPLIINNMPGAGSLLGINEVARRAPDGYSLAAAGSLATLPVLYKQFTLDAVDDFSPVCMFGAAPILIMIGKAVPADNLEEFIAYAKANPGKVRYASHSSGVELDLGYFNHLAGTGMVKVPYKGGPEAVAAVLSDEVQVAMLAMISAKTYLDSGDMKTLGIVSNDDFSAVTEIKSVAANGLPGYDGAASEFGLIGPKGLDPDATQKLAAACQEAVGRDSVKATMAKFAMTPTGDGPDIMGEAMAADAELVKKQAEILGIEPK